MKRCKADNDIAYTSLSDFFMNFYNGPQAACGYYSVLVGNVWNARRENHRNSNVQDQFEAGNGEYDQYNSTTGENEKKVVEW